MKWSELFTLLFSGWYEEKVYILFLQETDVGTFFQPVPSDSVQSDKRLNDKD